MDNYNFEYEQKKKKKLKKGPLYVIGCLLCLVIGMGAGYFLRGSQTSVAISKETNIYDEIRQTLENDFLDTTDSQMSLKERILNGMVYGLGDPHTSYLSQEQSAAFTTSVNGSFQGIGVTFTTVDEGGLILQVYQNTPAAKAGVLAGDMITKVEGTSIAGYTSEKIKNTIQGESGSEVSLHILRDGKELDLKVKRESVETSVASQIKTVGKEKVGYLTITTFGERTSDLVEGVLKSFQKDNVKHLVIDLRDNSGGYLDAAHNILDLLIKDGEVLFRVEPKQGKEQVYKATNREKYTFDDGYILVNGDSASASEVVTAALKEVLGYKVVGEKTYGKGTAQTQKVFADSSVLKYTNAKWLTPKGDWVNGKGIKPDYEVKMKSIGDFHVGEMKKSYHFDQVDDNVMFMQEKLKELGYPVDREDGYFSQKTKTALEAFEKDYHLKVDGIYDKNDSMILLSALSYHIYQKTIDQGYQKIEELIK